MAKIIEQYGINWSINSQRIVGIKTREQAQALYEDNKFCGVLLLEDDIPVGWIRFGKAKKTGVVEVVVQFLEDTIDRRKLFEMKETGAGVLQINFASFFYEDGSYLRFYKVGSEWKKAIFKGAKVLQEFDEAFACDLPLIAFRPFVDSNEALFENLRNVGPEQFPVVAR